MITLYLFAFSTFLVGTVSCSVSQLCARRKYSHDSVVCVCNSTYCDHQDIPTRHPKGQYLLYTTSRDGQRMVRTDGVFNDKNYTNLFIKSGISYATEGSLKFTINKNKTFQKVLGFGGTFSDSTGSNILSLPAAAQNKLLRSYFTKQGNGYTLGRVPIGSTDFSTRPYTYNENSRNFNQSEFMLQYEDFTFKIPIIRKASRLVKEKSTRTLKIIGVAWGPPGWMKTNDQSSGKGELKGEPGGKYYKSWALYYIKFVQEYLKNGVELWGLTTGAEPTSGEFDTGSNNSDLGFTATLQRDFIAKDLGPTIEQNGLCDLKLFMMDDQPFLLPEWTDTILSDPAAAKYVSGLAFQAWFNFYVRMSKLTDFHNKYPDMLMIQTERADGALPWEPINTPAVQLGSWLRAENYAVDITRDLKNWVNGWIDWNLVVDLDGGPHWMLSGLDAPIIVNASAGEFYKQPTFYIIGHFSKFLVPDSIQLEVMHETNNPQVTGLAFQWPDGATVFIIHNSATIDMNIQVNDLEIGQITATMPAKSIQTYVWWQTN